jgi:membrane associated rhomboid family serine protease
VLIIRVITATSGVISLLLAYCFSHVDQALHLAAVASGVVSGPLLAVFAMGFFVPFANNVVS